MTALVNPLQFYGANYRAIQCREPEVMLSGPADTGKTLALLTKWHACACWYPGASLVIARKQLTDVYSTVLQTFTKKVIHRELEAGIITAYGGEKPQWFDYRNGSRIWIAGLDKAGKVLSAEHDGIYTNQAEELSLPDWEILTTRTTGRAGNMPYSQTIGDCNPGPPTHWIRTRAQSGQLTLLQSTHYDNPEIYDPATGELTEQGQRRLARLRGLSGARLLRLYHGLWAAPEGAIYSVFDEEKHRVKAFDIPATWPRFVGIDPVGAYIAAVWIALDPRNNILNVYREYLGPFGVPTRQHAQNILQLSEGETVFYWVVGQPAERQPRADFQSYGIPARPPAFADLWMGIDRVNALLTEFSMVVHDSCPNLLSEIGDYRRKLTDGEPTEQIENKDKFHMLDSLRYAVVGPEGAGEIQQVVYRPVQVGRQW